VLEEEGYPAPEAEEGGTEGEEVSSEEATVAAPAEGEGEEQSEPEEEVAAESEAEVPAEATPAAEAEGEGEEQSEPEEEVAAESEAEVTAEATPAAEAEVPAEAENTVIPATHTVVAGENLYRIGLQYGISWVVIAEANNLSNPNQIYTGQVLNLSGTGGQPEPMPTPEGINYLVKPGDTLFKIAQHFGISWVEIAEANGLVNPNEIYAGQMIKIPVDAPMPPPVVHHLVKPGETLFRISLHYGVPWLAIARANKIDSPYLIYAGQTLTIPGGR
jgi:LysM repeat protein